MKNIQISNIAQELNISASTVSRALNDKPGVSQSLKQQIIEKAEALGYQTPRAIKKTNLTKSHIIALITSDIKNPFHIDLIGSLQNYLSRYGYTLTVFDTNYDPNEEIRCIELIKKLNYSGVVLVEAGPDETFNQLSPSEIPMVAMTGVSPTFNSDKVLIDDERAAYIATNHLINLGHTRIGFLKGNEASFTAADRYRGFCQCMKDHSLEINEEYILQGDFTIETGYKLAADLIENCTVLPSGMVICNDYSAFGFITACKDNGINIPGQMSVIGFDNIQLSYSGVLQLTTIDIHAEEKGRRAGELIINRINNPGIAPQCINIEPILIKRKTTAPCRRS